MTRSTPLPLRPRLADHVSARRHRARNEDAWVLYDNRSGQAYRVGVREWGLLLHADGTRDLEGIIAAASRTGTLARVSALQSFLEALHQAGLLADGVDRPAEPPPVRPPLPIDSWPNYRLSCDGLGSCCRLYSTIMVRPVEEARARGLLPLVFDSGDHPERLFAPLTGSAPCGASSFGFVDGRCVYLEADGRCALHAAGGPEGKPLGCRMFPALFVDDGQAVRVSAAIECACVLASLDKPDEGELLVPNHVRSSDDLDPGIHITSLPETIALTKKRRASRDELVRWSRIVAASSPPTNVPGAFLALAEAVETWGLDLHAATVAMASHRPVDPDAMRPAWIALAERTQARLKIDGAWRSDNDLAFRAIGWIHRAAKFVLTNPDEVERLCSADRAVEAAKSEAFYLQAGAHGHHFVLGDAPLVQALRDRATRVVLARAVARVVSEDELRDEPALRHPLALVEATLRGHGLLVQGVLL